MNHLVNYFVTGLFSQYECQMETIGDEFVDTIVKYATNVSSNSIGNEQQDSHLNSANLFVFEPVPELIFT